MSTKPRTIALLVLLGIVTLLLFLPSVLTPVVHDLALVRAVRTGATLTRDQFAQLERRLQGDAPLGDEWVDHLTARIRAADLSREFGPSRGGQPSWHRVASLLRKRGRLSDEVWVEFVSHLADVVVLAGEEGAAREAWSEIHSLRDAGALPPEAEARFGELTVILHGKVSRAPHLDDLIVGLRAQGEVPDGVWREFLRQLRDVALLVPAEVREGDPLPFDVDIDPRGGDGGRIRVAVELDAVLVDGTEVSPRDGYPELSLDLQRNHVPAPELPAADGSEHTLSVVVRFRVDVKDGETAPALLAPTEWTEEHTANFRVAPSDVDEATRFEG